MWEAGSDRESDVKKEVSKAEENIIRVDPGRIFQGHRLGTIVKIRKLTGGMEEQLPEVTKKV